MLLCFFLPLVFLIEALHSAGSIDDFLLAREERVAFVAQFYSQSLPGRASCETVAARTCYRGIGEILGMDFLFHCHCPG